MTDNITHTKLKCSMSDQADLPWSIEAVPVPGQDPVEILRPDPEGRYLSNERVAMVYGDPTLDVTAEERARRIVEAVNDEHGPNDKLDDIQGQLHDMQERIENIEAHTKAVETATSNAAHRECDRLAQELDNVRDKIRELHEYLEEELSISQAFKESFEPYALTKELHYWRGKTDECAKILDKFNFLFDK